LAQALRTKKQRNLIGSSWLATTTTKLATMRFFLVLGSIVALAAGAGPKSAAVDKVISLLENLKKHVQQEGKNEAKTYDKFACFCKENIKDKQAAVQAGRDAQSRFKAAIKVDTALKGKQTVQITDLGEKMSKKDKLMQKWRRISSEDNQEYEINSADLRNAINGLQGAIKVMKVNKAQAPKGAFLQLSTGIQDTIKTAAVMADALGLVPVDVTSLLQDPFSALAESSSLEKIKPYGFHANGIVASLQKLLDAFKKEKNSLDSTERKRKDNVAKKLKTGKYYVKKKGVDEEDTKDDKSKTSAQLARESQDLTGITQQLNDDKQYLKELVKICSDKAKTFDQRSKVRASEITALTTATGIIKQTVAKKVSKRTARLIQTRFAATRAQFTVLDEDSMEAIEGDAEEMESPVSFLQRPHLDAVGMATRELDYELDHPETMALAHKHEQTAQDSPVDAGRQAVMMLLKKQGVSLHSSLLAELATTIAVDPFAKVTKLLQELVERLLQQAGNEANQKGWCDKNIGEAEQKRDYNQGKLDKLKAEKEELSARADSLIQDLATLKKEIKGLNKTQRLADKTRKAETVENAATVKEAIEGLNAVKQAMDVLNRFYKTANNERTNKIKLGLVQGPADDAPATTFEAKESYKGNQGAAGGILGMLQVIMGDFVRTVKLAEQAEASADKDHLQLSTQTQMSLAEKKQASNIKSTQRDEAKQNIEEAKSSIKAKSALLKGVLKELKELEPVCSPPGQSPKERAEKREEEVKALQKALQLFEDFDKK